MIYRLDQAIGRIIDTVEKAGIADNTLIIFMSENGGNAEEIARGKRETVGGPCEIAMTCAGNIPGLCLVVRGLSKASASRGATVPIRRSDCINITRMKAASAHHSSQNGLRSFDRPHRR
jgi:arylsulfatase A-like enzyme